MPHQGQYYQLGGFQGHTFPWFKFDYNALARAVAGANSPLNTQHGGIELILGIWPSGATSILMSENQMMTLARALRLRSLNQPWRFSRFVSLSPIYFPDVDHLFKKLATYKPKNKKGRATLQDTSQANRNYWLSAQVISGLARGAFEHGRVFHRILKGDLDLHKFGLQEIPWRNSVQIYSLVFNTWAMDSRPPQERLRNPLIMDIGLTELDVSTLRPKTEPGATLHFFPSSSRRLGQGRDKADFAHGQSESLDSESLSTRLRGLFPTTRRSTTKPVVLLVFGDSSTRSILQSSGVDTSNWESGIASLLGFPNHQPDNPESRNCGSDPRSQSPRPRNTSERNRSKKHRSPSLEQDTYAPVYIIDVQEMYSRLTERQDPPLSEMVNRFFGGGMTGWCAGNECHLLAHAWQSMIEGPSIDEQRNIRSLSVRSDINPPEISGVYPEDPGANAIEPEGNEDDEEDEDDEDDDFY